MNIDSVLIDKLIGGCDLPDRGVYSFVNPYSYKLLGQRLELVEELDGLFVDGGVLVRLFRIILRKNIQRMSFDNTSLAPRVFKKAEQEQKSIFFVGGSSSEVERFVERVASSYPNLIIAGFSDGFCGVLSDEFSSRVLNSNPDLVIAGLGTPLQEEFLVNIKSLGWDGLGFSCGGYIRQGALYDEYFPSWSNRLGLRWLVRLWREPHVLKRLAVNYPANLFRISVSLLKIRMHG